MYQSFSNSNNEFKPHRFIKELDKLYFSGLALTIFLCFLTASIVSLILWGFHEHKLIIYWFMSYSLFCCLRYITYISYQNNKPLSVEACSIWFVLLFVGAFISGLFWGGMGIAANEFIEFSGNQSLIFNFSFAIVIAILVAMSSLIYKSHPGLMLSFSVPASLPFSIFLLNQSIGSLFLIGLLLFAYLVALLSIYTGIDKMFYRVTMNSLGKLFSISDS